MTVTFRDVKATDGLKQAIEKKIERIKTHFREVEGIDVVLTAPHKHHHKGNLFSCHIEAHIPRRPPCVVGRDSEDHAHEDPYVAIRDAFAALERQLEHATAPPRH